MKEVLSMARAMPCAALAVCLLAPGAAVGQTEPPPAAKDRAAKDEKAAEPDKSDKQEKPERERAARPAAPETKRADERIRLDAPVSFPVDI
jgi:hypothetical protein